MDSDTYTARWLDRLTGLYEYEKKGRLRELNGDRPKEWRGDGLHERSYLWGLLDAATPEWLRDAMAEAPDLLAISPKQLRDAATGDGTDEFVRRLAANA